MKILQVANFVHPASGGLGRAVSALAHEYRSLGHDVRTVFPSDSECVDPSSSTWTVHGVRIPTMGPYRAIVSRRPLKDIITHYSPDIVEVSDKTTLAWLAPWCARRGILVTVISHERTDLAVRSGGLAGVIVRPLVRAWRRTVERWAPVIVCASPFASEEFRGTAPVVVVPFGVDTNLFHPGGKPESWSEPLRLVTCGRLSPEKKTSLAIEAVRVLAPHMSVELCVVGDGPLRAELEERARGLPVTFAGNVSDREDVAAILRSADVVVNLGSVETFGLVTLEALASGTPVIASREGASPCLLTSSSGRLVGSDPTDVARKVLDIVSLTRIDVSDACREHALTFTWRTAATRILSAHVPELELRRAG